MPAFILSISLAIIFYLAIPGVGAWIVRARWRRFRRLLYSSTEAPIVTYADIRAARDGHSTERRFRFFGSLEALQGDDRLWLRDGGASVEVDMRDGAIAILPPNAVDEPLVPPQRDGAFPSESPQIIPWRRMSSLTEGTKVFVYGILSGSGGNAVFATDGNEQPLVMLYDGPETTVISRAVWTGRQRNEYWSSITPVSLLSGMLALALLALALLRSPVTYSDGLLTLGLSALPVLPLAPPGIAGYFVYRFCWRRGRAYRARRDLVRLPTTRAASGVRQQPGSVSDGASDPEHEAYRSQRHAVLWELSAVSIFAVSVFLNYILFVRAVSVLL